VTVPFDVASVLDALARRLAPIPPIPFSEWLQQNIVLVDGPDAGALWKARGAPYLVDIADCLGDDHPCNLVTIRKSQQTGASILALAWCLYIADREPANVIYAAPTGDLLRDLNSGKLQPLIDAWHKRLGREVFEPQTARSGVGSTTYEKVFPRGRLWLANANTVTDLSSKTAKKGVKDEVSKWQDIPGYGDPETLFFGRFTAFRRRGNWKILEISTPEVDTGDPESPGHCRVDRSFQRSDQRFWHCDCPACGEAFVHDFRMLQIDAAHPHKTCYACPHCGALIDDAARVPMIRAGRWIATAPTSAASEAASDPLAAQSGATSQKRHPGFHIDAFISLLMSYEAIAEDWLSSRKKGEIGAKDFSNLDLGLPYLFKGDAPDHVKLMERREEGLTRGHIPARGLILTASADVQGAGIWVEVLATAPDRATWPVEVLYLDGSTESVEGEAFAKLRERVLERDWPDAFGGTRRLDALGVDSGFRSHVVYAWVRQNQRLHPETGHDVILALDGREGWGRPAIGTPSLVDIDLAGHKLRKGVKLWPVGTWPLKGAFYADLHKVRNFEAGGAAPDGYCHFGTWLDEDYFRQITAEHLVEEAFRGRMRRIWKRVSNTRDNHLLDCRVYNLAVAEYLGLSATTDDEWKALARRRGMPEAAVEANLFTHTPREPGTATADEPAPSPRPRAEQTPTQPAANPFARLAALNRQT